MAKVEDNVLSRGFSGTIGKQLTFRQIGGQTFVSKYRRPPSDPPTEKQWLPGSNSRSRRPMRNGW